jgi:phospho-N-acetylmuramoyl-pentapeptide-transferase
MIGDVVKIFLPTALAFIIGILITPIVADYLYRNRMWKKKAGKMASDGSDATVFNQLHKEKEVGTPRMGGTIIWLSASIVILGTWFASKLFPGPFTYKLDFLSRSQTWIPFATLLIGALVGLFDDYLEIRGGGSHHAGGLSLKRRLAIVGVLGLAAGWWFYAKLGMTMIGLPFGYVLLLGWLIIPLCAIVMMATYSSGVIDGIDGLAGGIFASIFAAYAGIAFMQHQIDLAAFCAVLVGAILAFLWFNIPPARFYMSETGSMALTITLAIVAFMTDYKLGGGYGILVLPIVAFPLVITAASVILQLLSKKIRGKKLFRVAPLHHHFEALGWSQPKVTMRYWVIGVVFAIIGMIVAVGL